MSDWWIPQSVAELEGAVTAGTVTETHHLEFKAFTDEGSVPPVAAKSIAGLAVDGGVLVLGVAEDKPNDRFELRPRPLAGLQDRLDQILANRVTPGLRVPVTNLTKDDGTGYLVVHVPASARAPHMVDGRYYGRNEKTSRPLADVEVRRLLQRHLDRRDDQLQLLQAEVGREPAGFPFLTNARLFIVAQPISADPRLLLDAVEDRDLFRWVEDLTMHNLMRRGRSYGPTLAQASDVHRRSHGASRSSSIDPDRVVRGDVGGGNVLRHVVDLEVREDGGLRLYYGRASDQPNSNSPNVLLLSAILGETAGVIEGARIVSKQSRYVGSWTFGVALRGIRGIAAYSEASNVLLPFDGGWRFSEDVYDEVVEADWATLHQPGSPVLEALMGRLVRATKGPTFPVVDMDPFAVPPSQ